MKKQITLNGKPADTEASIVRELVIELGFPKGGVLVEQNGNALRPDEWERPIEAGDRFELMRVVAGG